MKILRLLVINGLVFAGLILVVGIGIELWARTRPRSVFVQFDPVLGWKLQPNTDGEFHGLYFTPNPQINTTIHIDSLGLRGPEVPVEKPAGTRRVVVLGDSYVQAFEVPYEKTFYARIAALANGRRPGSLDMVPMGVLGYGNAQELLWLRGLGARLKPDVVVLIWFLTNDVSDNSDELLFTAGRPYFRLVGDSLRLTHKPAGLARYKYWAAEHIRSYTFFRDLGLKIGGLRNLLTRLGLAEQEEPRSQARESADPRVARAFALTFALVKEIARETEAMGAQFLVAYHGTYSAGAEKTSDQAVADFCTETRLRCIDLNPLLAGNPSNFVPDDGHWTSAGHEIVAQALWHEWQPSFLPPPLSPKARD